jgi:transposase InsO family protein
MEKTPVGQILHNCATTTHAVRAAIQRSQDSVAALAQRYGINQKTVRKWRARKSVNDLPMGPKAPRSTVLSVEEEAVCVAFRKHTLLPLDDFLYALQESIPHLTRSSLHRLYQRHGISRLPDLKTQGSSRRKFKSYAIGYFHIDIAEVRTEDGKLHMFVAIGRTSKFVFVELYERVTRSVACQFLRNLIEAVPYQIHTVLTDNGIQFCHPPRYRDGPTARYMGHQFDRICAANGIEHRLTKPNHPWTNGQVERMNRTIKEATVKRYHYESHEQLRGHLQTFVNAYNFAKRLKTLRGLTPFEYVVKRWTEEPERFYDDPTHHFPGLNT